MVVGNTSVDNCSITKNVTKQSKEVDNLSTGEWFLIAAFSMIILIGVIGNIFVIYVFGYKRKSKVRSTTEWLILYLAIIDLLSSAFNPSLYIYWTATRYSVWHFGFVGCKILPAIGPITTSVSSAFLLIFAVDRYVAIVSPFRGQLSWKRLTGACIVAIVLSIISYFHYMYKLHLTANHICVSTNVKDKTYGIPNSILVIMRLSIFAFLFSFTNYKIFMTLSQNERLPAIRSVREQRYAQSRNIIRVLLTMGLIFVILVYPREIFYVVFNISWLVSEKGIISYKIALQANSWLKVMHTSNSCANIFIYAHMQTRLRRQILKVFHSFGLCKQSYNQTPNSFAMSFMTPLGKLRRRSLKKSSPLLSTNSMKNTTTFLNSTTNSPTFFQRAQSKKNMTAKTES